MPAADDAMMANMAATNPHAPPPTAAYAQSTPQQQAPPVPQPHPDLQRPPAQAGEQRSSPYWVDPAEWASTQTRLRELSDFKREYDKILETKENDRLKLMAEKGQVEQALSELRAINDRKLAEVQQRAQQVEQNWLQEHLNQVINEVLTGREFIGKDPAKTAAMVRRNLKDEIEAVIGPNGLPQVRDKVTLRPAIEYLRERLDSPDSEFAICFRAKSGGGSGTDGTRTDATPLASPAPVLNPDQAVQAWQKSPPIASYGLHRKQA